MSPREKLVKLLEQRGYSETSIEWTITDTETIFNEALAEREEELRGKIEALNLVHEAPNCVYKDDVLALFDKPESDRQRFDRERIEHQNPKMYERSVANGIGYERFPEARTGIQQRSGMELRLIVHDHEDFNKHRKMFKTDEDNMWMFDRRAEERRKS